MSLFSCWMRYDDFLHKLCLFYVCKQKSNQTFSLYLLQILNGKNIPLFLHFSCFFIIYLQLENCIRYFFELLFTKPNILCFTQILNIKLLENVFLLFNLEIRVLFVFSFTFFDPYNSYIHSGFYT